METAAIITHTHTHTHGPEAPRKEEEEERYYTLFTLVIIESSFIIALIDAMCAPPIRFF